MVPLPKEAEDKLLPGWLFRERFPQKRAMRTRVVGKRRWAQDRPLFEKVRGAEDWVVLQTSQVCKNVLPGPAGVTADGALFFRMIESVPEH